MLRGITFGFILLLLVGCGSEAIWVPILTSSLGYVASVNNLGAQSLKLYMFEEEKKKPELVTDQRCIMPTAKDQIEKTNGTNN